ncbi:uncharacterized protein LOC119828561 [Zerene cesonia]|uniref:uncharacterized protein LOC119828561 n=1 Tax=Zerene cesonia TaxID=33412 RepID=UPI0018E55C9F|nr:uncharacterized protein LOC119828561 [Zerene cesonia]
MPPKTRGNKTTKVLKENVQITSKPKLKDKNGVKKAPRKALADKTNSASDDNATFSAKKSSPIIDPDPLKSKDDKPKQRRIRRVPSRFVGNPVLTNLSNSSKDISSTQISTPTKPIKLTPTKKVPIVKLSPLKLTTLNNSIIKSRPKRICRLPSKLEGHSISPNKYIPLQPVHASTPIAKKAVKTVPNNVSHNDTSMKISPVSTAAKKLAQKNKSKAKPGADTNNNGKKQVQIDKCFEKQRQSANNKTKPRKNVTTNSSFRVFDDIKKSLKRDSSKLDPYEFTFDPDEEPPQKKKKKRAAKKPQVKPKTAVKGVYEKNLAKALASLKNTAKVTQTKENHVISKLTNIKQNEAPKTLDNIENAADNVKTTTLTQRNPDIAQFNISKSIPCENNYNSVRVEDIAQDLQHLDEGHNIDYSPVNSPHREIPQIVVNKTSHDIPANNKDPLNLQGDLSFFDDQPVASSSMNMSARHPLASPWRVEFGSLPIKWQANTYVKPNMTPAVESSFINASDTKKKHVYTNIVADCNESLPQVYEQPSMKQTSIISFIREVAERSANKKKKKSTPVKANTLFEDITHASLDITPTKSCSSKENSKSDQSAESEKSEESSKQKNSKKGYMDIDQENIERSLLTSPNKNDKTPKKRHTFFGFDESEEQENISPLKKDKRVRALRPRSRAVLQEINDMKGPSRAAIPLAVRSVLNSDILNKNFEGPKSGTEPPVFPDKDNAQSNEETVINPISTLENEESQSVHLFEDMDLIHHYNKPPRKSYGKAKKVAFRQNSATDSDGAPSEIGDKDSSSDEDRLEDLSFKLPTVKPKRKIKKKLTKKQQLTKKEEKEAETWAAGFNSMCEDIEEFDLVVE